MTVDLWMPPLHAHARFDDLDLGLMQGHSGSAKAKTQRCMLSATKQAIYSIKLATTRVGQFLRKSDHDFANVYILLIHLGVRWWVVFFTLSKRLDTETSLYSPTSHTYAENPNFFSCCVLRIKCWRDQREIGVGMAFLRKGLEANQDRGCAEDFSFTFSRVDCEMSERMESQKLDQDFGLDQKDSSFILEKNVEFEAVCVLCV